MREWNKKSFVYIGNQLLKPILNSKGFFKKLGLQIDRDTKLIFQNEGKLPGMGFHKWIDFGYGEGVSVYRLPSGKWASRPGTDNSKTRTFSPASKLLQASGGFRKSWNVMSWSDKKLKYGTDHKLADEIMNNPERNVLKFNERRYTSIRDIFFAWVDRGIKI